jgi:aminoglycoside phosphotransferase (APT) family kinase protein
MSRPWIDPAIAAQLAAVDPAVALLPDALAAVSRRRGCMLAEVRWTPGVGCRLAVRGVTRGRVSTFLAIDVAPAGWSHHDYRDDPTLAGIRAASDPREVRMRLAPGAAGSGVDPHIEPVRYRPASRCVLRYSLALEDVGSTVFAKAFRDQDFPTQRALVDVLEPVRSKGLVPDVQAIWPDLSVIVSDAHDGRPLSTVLADDGVSATERRDALRRLGAVLADFHGHPSGHAPSFSTDAQRAAMTPAIAAARRIDPAVGDRLAAVLDVLARSEPPRSREVLGHGAFRAGQAIVGRDGGPVLVDTDGVSSCDAARDLGRALAHLGWQSLRDHRLRSALPGAEETLLDGYAGRSAPVDPAALRWWHAAALVQLAARRYSRVEHDAWPDVPRLVDSAERIVAPFVRRPARVAPVDLTDVDAVSALVGPVLGGDRASTRSIRVTAADRLATRSRRRMVVRYRVTGLTSRQPTTVIGKAFTDDDHALRLYSNMRLLADGPFASSPLRVPQPLALVRDQRLVLWVASDGMPLDRIKPLADVDMGVRQAARWLARLHASTVVLPRRFSLDEEAANTRRWAATIGSAYPVLADRARRMAVDWVTAVGSGDAARVPIHKDFHPGHVLIGRETTVIDLDEARLGDPALDVAHFRAYLGLLSSHRAAIPALERAFMEEYARESGGADSRAVDAYGAYAWLKIAKQWVVGSGPGRGATRAMRIAGAAEALARGERCLVG